MNIYAEYNPIERRNSTSLNYPKLTTSNSSMDSFFSSKNEKK